MSHGAREVWITGVGIVSCLGDGPDAHWEKLVHGRPCADAEKYPPYLVHPLCPIELGKQIPRKTDQRQMSVWQQIGTYAASREAALAAFKTAWFYDL